MTEPGAPVAEVDKAEPTAAPPPPRRPTILVRYSRTSKLAAAALLVVGCVASIYVIGKLTSEDGLLAPQRYAPHIHGADTTERMLPQSQPAAPADAKAVSGTADAPALNAQDDRSLPMVAAPDPNITETTPQGDLPRVGDQGQQPWQVYARPFHAADKRPRIAILVTDLGLQRTTTDIAIAQLPANVSLAFDVQGNTVASWCAHARAEGHEILLSVPMEPFDYPHSDPGGHTLLTNLSNAANQDKLAWALRQASGYVGITTMSGSRLITETGKLRPVLHDMHERGLLFLDPRIAPHSAVTDVAHEQHVPFAMADLRIEDDDLSPENIDASFQQLEQTARLNGKALAVVAPLPIIIDRLQNWLKTLPQDGIALAPVSAVVQ